MSHFKTGHFTFMHHNYKHGLINHRLYFIWSAIKKRCTSKTSKPYKNHGGRGIKMADEWQDFNVFYKWCIDNGWKDGLSIDREDNDGDYSPDNCRFVTATIQAKNRRSTIMLSYKGETMCLMDWSKRINISHEVLRYRYHKGHSVERILKIKSK